MLVAPANAGALRLQNGKTLGPGFRRDDELPLRNDQRATPV